MEGETIQGKQSRKGRVMGEGVHGQMQSTRPGTQNVGTDVDTDRCVGWPRPASFFDLLLGLCINSVSPYGRVHFVEHKLKKNWHDHCLYGENDGPQILLILGKSPVQ